MGGDKIEILPETGEVVLNGVVLEEKYIQGKTLTRDFERCKDRSGRVSCCDGDNRSVSKDSRSAEVGFVNVKDVVGRAIFRFYPLERIGLLK